MWAYDIAQICRLPIATLDNDSMGCYDRMIPIVLSLLFRRIGFPKNATTTFINQLLHRQWRVQTAYGLSDTMPMAPNEYIGGIGQGSPDGPTGYHLQLLTLLKSKATLTIGYSCRSNCFHRICPTCCKQRRRLQCPYNVLKSERNLPRSTQIKRLLLRTEHILQAWVNLFPTGGEILFANSLWTVYGQWESTKSELVPTPP